MSSNDSFLEELREREERCGHRLEQPKKLKDQVKIAFPKKEEERKGVSGYARK